MARAAEPRGHRTKRGRRAWLAVAFALAGVAFLGDWLTGAEISFSPFYLVGIGVGTWFAGRRAGVALSLASTAGWVGAYLLTGQRYSRPSILYWNVGVEVTIFFAVMVALDRVRSGIEQERVLRDQLEFAYRRLDQEMSKVGDLQRSLLPPEPPRVPGYRVAVDYATSARAGGDYYDFFLLPDGRLGVLVADASGHGTPAAVLMAMTRVLLRTAEESLAPPDRVFVDLNRQLARTIPSARFVTACYAVLEPAAGGFEYALAGHNPPLLVSGAAGRIDTLDAADGPPLGVFEDAAFERRVARLEVGDTIVLYTDGWTEAMDAEGRMFGEDRLRTVVLEAASLPADAMRDRLVEALGRHLGAAPAADDRTLVLLRRDARVAAKGAGE